MSHPAPMHERPAILALGTALPPFTDRQENVGQWMADSFRDQPAVQRLIRSLYSYSGIETRHTCTDEFQRPAAESPFAPGRPLHQTPTTAQRLAIYQREAPPLGEQAARAALARYAETANVDEHEVLASITHLIVVSCTGFFAPGLDFVLADRLGLPSTLSRTVIGFMGCSAAFNGLRMASQIVAGDPEARVLMISVELCSLHIQPGTRRDDLVSASIFADGAAAAIVGVPSTRDHGYFTLDRFHTDMKPNTRDEMVWHIADHGFILNLSPRIPDHLADVAPGSLAQVSGTRRPDFWAIHPGGRSIVDGLQEIFELDDHEVASSRTVLRDQGNMSSATILFVLAEEARRLSRRAAPATGVAMAFGPGLTIEMAQLTHVPFPTEAAPPYRNGRVAELEIG